MDAGFSCIAIPAWEDLPDLSDEHDSIPTPQGLGPVSFLMGDRSCQDVLTKTRRSSDGTQGTRAKVVWDRDSVDSFSKSRPDSKIALQCRCKMTRIHRLEVLFNDEDIYGARRQRAQSSCEQPDFLQCSCINNTKNGISHDYPTWKSSTRLDYRPTTAKRTASFKTAGFSISRPPSSPNDFSQ